ncbi:imidazolonepropionase [Flammeovirga agarivorans]|uniref:Imidazolonepropionase n=1 Tax=Flammeovirga agarivorans TaxID=2726742 RepID=A0A7X8SM97_9BACT|nr:imidazolonepropionase [Flammeovirga agarivorans]NLR92737.1 imidazolonepropionase [Flammeovirga agarivorans]
MNKLIGPFTQIVTLANLPMKGRIEDEQLEIIDNAGVSVDEDGNILAIKTFADFDQDAFKEIETIDQEAVLIPGFVDCHTHICWGGNRARDYAMRVAGKPYLEIAKAGGGIQDSMKKTRAASEKELKDVTVERADRHFSRGVTTIEVKSGYALDIDNELKMLRSIKSADKETKADLITTCLAAHMKPKDFEGSSREYLDRVLDTLLPEIKKENLSNRVDIFTEETAFNVEESNYYLSKAKDLGFDITVHADQFSTGGSKVAVDNGALSAEHLESSTEEEVKMLAESETVATVLPGASLGLGMQYPPCRKLLDAGACLAIASDWNPGSAPMGDMLIQGALLGAMEKLSTAEVFAGMTFRSAKALGLSDRGKLEVGKLADMQAYPCNDYREILYNQGMLPPFKVWKKGN